MEIKLVMTAYPNVLIYEYFIYLNLMLPIDMTLLDIFAR